MKKLTVKSVVLTCIGAAMFFLLGRISIPTPISNTYISLQYAIEAVFAALLGPIAGMLIGFIGHTLVDVTTSEPSWSWITASVCVGLVIGLGTMRMDINEGIDIRKIIRFNAAQTVAHLLAWGIIASCLDILIYREPVDKVFIQGLTAGIANIITTGIVGTLILVAYVDTVVKKDISDQED